MTSIKKSVHIYLYSLLFLILFFGCGGKKYRKLETNNIIIDKSKYDEYLINRVNGIHRLTGYTPSDSSKGIILVHGYYPSNWRTKGHEWTTALKDLAESEVLVWWFKHDWNDCPEVTSQRLAIAIDSLKIKRGYLDQVYVIGHSLGGLVVSDLAEKWNSNLKLTIHAIAAPLSHYSERLNSCEVRGKEKYTFSDNVDYVQWRTSKYIDGAFKHLEKDPQNVDLINGDYILLPKEWNGKRLGHNLSIQLVVDQFLNKINLF